MMEKAPSVETGHGLEILDACPDDAVSFRELEYKVWKDTYANKKTGITEDDISWLFNERRNVFSPEMIEKFAEEIKNIPEGEKAIVVKDGNRVVGIAWLLNDGTNNEIGSIYIHPDYQKRGIGKKIWNKALDFFDPTRETIVTVHEDNQQAIGYYSDLGFIETEKLKPQLTFPSGNQFREIKMIRPSDSDGDQL